MSKKNRIEYPEDDLRIEYSKPILTFFGDIKELTLGGTPPSEGTDDDDGGVDSGSGDAGGSEDDG